MPIRDLRRGAEGVRLSPLRPAAAADATFMALQPIPRKGAGRGEFKCPRPNPEGGKRVTVAENLRVIDSGIDALNAHDWVRFVGLHAESITDVNPATPSASIMSNSIGRFRTFEHAKTGASAKATGCAWRPRVRGRTKDRCSVPADTQSLRRATPSA